MVHGLISKIQGSAYNTGFELSQPCLSCYESLSLAFVNASQSGSLGWILFKRNHVPLLELSYQNADINIYTHLFFFFWFFLHLWLISLVMSTTIWWILHHCCLLLTLHSTTSLPPSPCPSSTDQKQSLGTHFVVVINPCPIWRKW